MLNCEQWSIPDSSTASRPTSPACGPSSPIDLTAAVPSCPGWTVADLTRHVGEVYLHKTAGHARGRRAQPVAAERSSRTRSRWHCSTARTPGCSTSSLPANRRIRPGPGTPRTRPSASGSDGWRRRRSSTASTPSSAPASRSQPVPADLAVDGIDELLKVFVAYSVATWGDYFTAILAGSPGRTYTVRTDGAAWRVRTGPGLFAVEDGAGDGTADVTVSGPPTAVLRWVWNRESRRRAERRDGRGRPGGGRGAAALHRHCDAVRSHSRAAPRARAPMTYRRPSLIRARAPRGRPR